MNRLSNPKCPQCGETMRLRFVKSTGMDIEQTGLFADCPRCSYSEKVPSLRDEKELVEET